MKVDSNVLDVQSTLTGRKIKATIDPDEFGHIMDVLTNLYEDSELAVIREYSTNARDAHVEAGNPAPIEVTLPSTLSPYLVIRDYGNGLDGDDIENIYSRYGASTKRDTNEQVGSLGLGCKSAWTYTDQFTVQGIKNGKCIQVAISRDEDGSGSFTVVSEYDTDEASGVEITVPVRTYNSFERKAAEFFQYWPEGSVLVNGEEPEKFSGIELGEGIYVIDETHESKIVMGGVPYPATFDDDGTFSVVAFVDIGDVQFTPSREALKSTTKNRNKIADIGTKIANLKETVVQKMVDEAESKPEALRRTLQATRLFNFKGEVKYKGKVVPDKIEKPRSENPILVYRPWKRGYGARMVGDTHTLSTAQFPTSLFFVGFTTRTLSQTQKRKISEYCDQQGIQYGDFEQAILIDELPYSSWVEKNQIVEWEEVNSIKLKREENLSGRPKGAYDIINPGNSYTEVIEAADIPLDVPLYWYPHDGIGYGTLEVLRKDDPNCVCVALTANRVGKFERDFAHAEKANTAATKIAQDWYDNLTQDERNWLAVNKMSDEWAEFDETKIDDPVLQTIVRLSKVSNDALLARSQTYRNWYVGDIEEISTDDYPLLSLRGLCYKSGDDKAAYIEHITLYMNAVYTYNQQTEEVA